MTTTTAVKINVGCGSKPIPGWTNMDARTLPGVDIVHDVRAGMPYGDGMVEEIYAKHVVEHFSPSEWFGILKEWVRVLRPGGRLVIECPDLQRCAQNFAFDRAGGRWGVWYQAIYGEDYPGGAHRQGFTIPLLREQLEAAGLRVTRARHWHDDVNMGERYNIRMEAEKP